VIGVSEQRIDLIEIVPDGLGGWEKRESFLTLTE
jgi:Tfp pilus assembly protein PilP